MEIALPEGRQGRILALVLAGVTLAVLWLGVAAPLIGWHAQLAEDLGRKQALLRRMTELAASLPELQRAEAAAAARGPTPAAVLEGATDAVAGATLQGLVQDMAARAGANLTSTETLPAEPRGGWRRIGLRVAVTAPWPALLRLLQSVEEATPRMLLDGLQMRRLPVRARTATVPPMEASFTVFSFRTSPGGPRTESARP
jgi:general secretion pathway protein M